MSRPLMLLTIASMRLRTLREAHITTELAISVNAMPARLISICICYCYMNFSSHEYP